MGFFNKPKKLSAFEQLHADIASNVNDVQGYFNAQFAATKLGGSKDNLSDKFEVAIHQKIETSDQKHPDISPATVTLEIVFESPYLNNTEMSKAFATNVAKPLKSLLEKMVVNQIIKLKDGNYYDVDKASGFLVSQKAKIKMQLSFTGSHEEIRQCVSTLQDIVKGNKESNINSCVPDIIEACEKVKLTADLQNLANQEASTNQAGDTPEATYPPTQPMPALKGKLKVNQHITVNPDTQVTVTQLNTALARKFSSVSNVAIGVIVQSVVNTIENMKNQQAGASMPGDPDDLRRQRRQTAVQKILENKPDGVEESAVEKVASAAANTWEKGFGKK